MILKYFLNYSKNLLSPRIYSGLRIRPLSDEAFELPLSKYIASEILLQAKRKSNITFDDLAKKLNVNKVWLTSAILGQQSIDEEKSKQLVQLLNVDDKIKDKLVESLMSIPNNRGQHLSDQMLDPTIRRFRELIDIYGDTFKNLIREELGDGIMSAIDCTINFDKQTSNDGKESRIVITINGKYLQYKNDKSS